MISILISHTTKFVNFYFYWWRHRKRKKDRKHTKLCRRLAILLGLT